MKLYLLKASNRSHALIAAPSKKEALLLAPEGLKWSAELIGDYRRQLKGIIVSYYMPEI